MKPKIIVSYTDRVLRPLPGERQSTTYAERFWSRVDRGSPDECWPWTGRVGPDGYGLFYLPVEARGQRNTFRSHRVAWELSNGQEIPDGFSVLHACDNPPCCNPFHIRVGTAAENSADMVTRGRAATGDRHSSKTHPDRVARGERHGSRTKPESVRRGDKTTYRMYPEKCIRGDGSSIFGTPPELIPEGAVEFVSDGFRALRFQHPRLGTVEVRIEGVTGWHVRHQFPGNETMIGWFGTREEWLPHGWTLYWTQRFDVPLSEPLEARGYSKKPMALRLSASEAAELEKAAENSTCSVAVVNQLTRLRQQRGLVPHMSEALREALKDAVDGGFAGTRGDVLFEAHDESKLHTIRVVEYEFPDSVVPYVEVEEAAGHSDAPARIYSFSAAVHALQNLREDEVWAVGNREHGPAEPSETEPISLSLKDARELALKIGEEADERLADERRADEPIERAAEADAESRISYAVDWGNGADETAVSAIRCNSDSPAMVLAVETGERACAVVAFLKACGIGVVEDATAVEPSETEPPATDSLTAEVDRDLDAFVAELDEIPKDEPTSRDALEMLTSAWVRDGVEVSKVCFSDAIMRDLVATLKSERAQHAEEIARLKVENEELRDKLRRCRIRASLWKRSARELRRIRIDTMRICAELVSKLEHQRDEATARIDELESEVTRLTAALNRRTKAFTEASATHEELVCRPLRDEVTRLTAALRLSHGKYTGLRECVENIATCHPRTQQDYIAEVLVRYPPLPVAIPGSGEEK